ncbi:hypothetical protein LA080_013164 [Diaporthe eres]|nr:hypothetical protein LA080_013164 [Diaporthe eres]
MLVGSAGAAAGDLRVGLHPAAAGNDHLLQDRNPTTDDSAPFALEGRAKLPMDTRAVGSPPQREEASPLRLVLGHTHGFTGKEKVRPLRGATGCLPKPATG